MKILRPIVLAAAAVAPLCPAGAQTPGDGAPPRGAVAGVVVEAATLRPVAGAQVVLEPAPSGVVPDGRGPGGHLSAGARSVSTDSLGQYAFEGMAQGGYRLHVSAMGYRPATVALRIESAWPAAVSIGLWVQPIVLEPVQARSAGAEPENAFAIRTASPPAGEARVAVERARQARHAASDARALTHADVQEAVTLGETDLFRALQRQSGVSARDDWSAELLTRGAPGDQTAVYWDGVPLFNPMHAVGAFSALNTDAVGTAFFHPGVQPAELRSGGAALLDVRSRPATAARLRGSAELSLVSGRLALEGPLPAGEGGWSLSARRSYADMAARGISTVLGGGPPRVPYAFADLAGRADWWLRGGTRLTVSGLHQADRLWGDVRGMVKGTDARWGSTAAQATLTVPTAAGVFRQSVGASRFAARVAEREPVPELGCPCSGGYYPSLGDFRGQRSDAGIDYLFAAGAVESWADGDSARTGVGYRLVRQATRYRTEGFWPYDGTRGGELSAEHGLSYGVLWAEHGWHPAPRLRMEGALRVEAGGEGIGFVRLAPSLAARYAASPALGLSAGLSRSTQYAQAIVPAGPGYNSVALSNLFWAGAGDGAPLLVADQATAGAEWWLGSATLASATVYARRSSGMIVPDPDPGWTHLHDLFAAAEGRTLGMDASVRRVAGRWTGSLAYAWNRTRVHASHARYAPPTARAHVLDATLLLRLGRRVRVGAAFTAGSGTAFTRYDAGSRDCMPDQPASCRYAVIAREPGAERAPAYRSLDLSADWSGTVRGVRLDAFLQLHNVLARRNPGAYRSSRLRCTSPPEGSCRDPLLEPDPESFHPSNNVYFPGLPFVPVAGLRVVF
ncbi:MAG TPA: TonB-dependent receptor [Longimicrobium sp.]|nr:TonB-dependent receptor [Longimicrobium sp.]